MKFIGIYFLGILLIFACAGIRPQIHQFENKEIIEGSFDKIWSAIIETFAEKNIPISTMEKVSGFIATEEMKFSSSYADCGSSPVGIKLTFWKDPLGKFNVFVKMISENKFNITITANYRITGNGNVQNCTSTGELEIWFMATLREKLSK